MKIAITSNHANQIDRMVLNTEPGQLLEFGEIGLRVFGKTGAGAAVGGYIFDHRNELPGWWRIVNRGGHPVADSDAIIRLTNEGHQIQNGVIVG